MTGLSLVDVINLKNNPSRESRLLIAEKVCDQFNGRHFTDEESIIVSEIFRLLAKDAEVAIRQSLSEKLKFNSRLPEDIAFMLANDVLQVALPILQFSPVLSENDLMVIVRGAKELAKLVAVAKRDVVTPMVSHEIVVKVEEVATQTLLTNNGSSIAADDLRLVIEQFSGSDSIMSALIDREVLPATVAERMIMAVSDSLKKALVAKHPKHFLEMTHAAQEAREEVTLSYAVKPSSDEQKSAIVDQMQQSNRLSSSIVIRAVCRGDIAFFSESVSRLSNLPKEKIDRLLHDGNIEGLGRIYRMAGLPDSVQDATMVVLKFVLDELKANQQPDTAAFTGRIIERIVSHGYDRSVNNMAYLLTLVGKKPHNTRVVH